MCRVISHFLIHRVLNISNRLHSIKSLPSLSHMSPFRNNVRSMAVLVVATAIGVSGCSATSSDDAESSVPPPASTAPSQNPTTVPVAQPLGHEVWLLDQSNTAGDGDIGAYGGLLHIYDGEALRSSAATAVPETIDFGGGAAELCFGLTDAYPVRPHMISFNADQTHGIISFVASGHVLIVEAATREPVACFRTEPGSEGARQAHAAIPTPDQRYLLVANQNGKKLERISTDYRNGIFVQELDATLPLYGDAMTPNGVQVETPEDPTIRPDTAPICPFIPSTGYPVYISLRGGGMLAADPYSTPMQIVAEYTAADVARDGCGFVEASGWVYANGGSRPANLAGWFAYRVPVGDRSSYQASNAIGLPSVEVIAQDDSGPRDAHGVVATGDGGYVWFFDRAADVAEVYDARNGSFVRSMDLRSALTGKPTTDIVDLAPDGRFLYAATRGPAPLSGAHAAAGESPGVLVIEVLGDGSRLEVRGHAPVINPTSGPSGERADPHGVAVRRVATTP